MTREQFVAAVLENAAGVKAYQWGYDGRNQQGLCDCIGLIKGAFAILDVPWGGGPGTNYTARHYANNLGPVMALRLGDVVLKGRKPGASGYSLPDTYKDDPDKTDYYHIGVVTQVNPLKITHCTSVPGGIKVDTSAEKWNYQAVLKPVSESKEGGKEDIMKIAIVEAGNGLPVNLRSGPGKTYPVLAQLKVGTEVKITDEQGEWAKVQCEELNGYMMSEFLTVVADDEPGETEPGETEPQPGQGVVRLEIPEDMAVALWEALDGVVGRG